MKLATLKNETRDGQLIIVSRDLKFAVDASDLAPTLQAAIDNWHSLQPKLHERYIALCKQEVEGAFPFSESACHSPLPRAYQWADGSAYVNHVELVRKARNAEMPESFWHDPLMYQGGSDAFLTPSEAIPLVDEKWGLDFESEIAVITHDVPLNCDYDTAQESICLFMLVNDVSLRNLIPGELAKGFGFYQSKPSSSFSPVAVTPDELGEAWDGRKLHLPLVTHLNGQLFGKPNAGVDMTFDFPTLVRHAAKSRPLGAGCIVGSGTVSNYDRSAGSSCLAEKRMLEIIEKGEAITPFLKAGDTVRIEMLDEKGNSIFGKIDQVVESRGYCVNK